MRIPDNKKEEESIDSILAMMDGNVDREVARKVLRKCDGDADKAALAMLDGDHGEESSQWHSQSQNAIANTLPRMTGPPTRANSPTIDLTGDDPNDDMSRALKASLESISQETAPKFGPSERPSDPNWAVVPSNAETGTDAQYYQTLGKAIEESMADHYHNDANEPYEPIPAAMREAGCPVVLRPTAQDTVYAALILQSLFFIPQVRERISHWRPSPPPGMSEASIPTSGPEHLLWTLVEIYAHMDLAQLPELNIDGALRIFDAERWSTLAEQPGELSHSMYILPKLLSRVASTLERLFSEQHISEDCSLPRPRCLHFQYGNSDSEPGERLRETCIVKVEVTGGESNDLLGRLSALLSKPQEITLRQEVIFEPSDVVTFHLSRSAGNHFHGTSTEKKIERQPFRYPSHIYLDQFLGENVELANAKRALQREMIEKIAELVVHKKSLTNFNDKDTLKDLRSSLYYFEHVADAKEDQERATTIQTTVTKLKSIIAKVEKEIQSTEEQIAKLKEESSNLFNCAELQKVRYDLRVVFVHDGLYGRKHLYTYVQEKGIWWKTVDSSITQVSEETVLTDPAGLHLNAGPYLLMYSRTLPESKGDQDTLLPWPEVLQETVKRNNDLLFEQLAQQTTAGQEHPPSSPMTPARSLAQTPSECTIESTGVEPSLSEDEQMVG
ncbi:hypothetical protein BJ138DRAFT_1004302 [Hygrophoropsis aurantiaca]|uniref:Uncharacterized protein n=1 Tax=Hygrophoropsis aurantiaca TaxID=72124 RepID=A0ACB8AIG6_9AGAM|nr:hypothetical protein BJ138DRAFT_1004302 [Hygrophoropsis aurantiaca]